MRECDDFLSVLREHFLKYGLHKAEFLITLSNYREKLQKRLQQLQSEMRPLQQEYRKLKQLENEMNQLEQHWLMRCQQILQENFLNNC